MKDSIDFLKRVAAHVTELFRQYTPELKYHNLHHTQEVVNRVLEITAHESATDRDKVVLLSAAWFHDVGHLFGEAKGHEQRSVAAMKKFLENEEIPEPELIKDAERCIMATHYPPEPADNLEKIICDADTYHFGTKDFKETNKQVKEELRIQGEDVLLHDWPKHTLQLLKTHRYFTEYCKNLLEEGKAENIKKWEKKAAKGDDGEGEKEDKVDKKLKGNLVNRGIQTMLRLASENHMKLSDMADGKANILISVNSIIIGVILSVLLRRLEVEPHLTIPTFIFLGSSVATIVVSILATLPKITEGRFSREDIKNKKTNLLFFGNYYRSTLDEYSWAMDRMMEDKEYLYNSVVKDIYHLGVVLARKYKLIRLAYYVFMIGILVSVLAFVLAVGLHKPEDAVQIVTPSTPPL